MSTQSIDLSAVKNMNFNGTEIKTMNLNGSEIWTGASPFEGMDVDPSWTLQSDSFEGGYTSYYESVQAIHPFFYKNLIAFKYALSSDGAILKYNQDQYVDTRYNHSFLRITNPMLINAHPLSCGLEIFSDVNNQLRVWLNEPDGESAHRSFEAVTGVQIMALIDDGTQIIWKQNSLAGLGAYSGYTWIHVDADGAASGHAKNLANLNIFLSKLNNHIQVFSRRV
jgi:hypothetical protein